MKGFRFSLWSMFVGVAAVSLACAALVKPNWIWALTLQATAISVLTSALLAALVYERGAARAFWIGFAVVGWGNLGLHQFPLSEIGLTSEVSEWLTDTIHPMQSPNAPYRLASGGESPSDAYSAPPAPVGGQPAVGGYPAWDPYAPAPDSAIERVSDARSVFAYQIVWIWPLLFAFLGGVVAQQLYLRRERLAARTPLRSSDAS